MNRCSERPGRSFDDKSVLWVGQLKMFVHVLYQARCRSIGCCVVYLFFPVSSLVVVLSLPVCVSFRTRVVFFLSRGWLSSCAYGGDLLLSVELCAGRVCVPWLGEKEPPVVVLQVVYC